MPHNILLAKLLALFFAFFQFPVLPGVLDPGNSVPPPPSSGMLVWWSADVGNNCSGVACADGASQNTWTDQSGNGNTGTLNFNPTSYGPCVASIYHTNQINGKPALTFNGVNTNTQSSTCFSVAGVSGGLNNQTGTTAFVVAEQDVSVNSTIMSGSRNSIQWDGVATQRLTEACTADIGPSTTTRTTGVWYQRNFTYNPSSGAYAFRLNRTTDGSGTNSKSITNNWLNVGIAVCGGSINTVKGQIAEFILYNRVLSGTEITTVETYLHSKYGL